MQDTHVSFRASNTLVTALYAQAQIAGCSLSEYLRSIAREKVGLQ